MISKRIVLIADRIKDHCNATLNMNNLEVVADSYFNPLYEALNKISSQVIHYETLEDFSNNIISHYNDVVLSIWSGTGSRNRRILVPAICEANNIAYVGGDSYLQAICQDKDLSKNFAAKYGIKSPYGVLLFGMDDLYKLKNLNYPAIVKPNFEGGSIGIFNCNVVKNYDEACEFAPQLLKSYNPILAEDYVEGEEISFCLSGNIKETTLFEVIRQYIEGKKYFKTEIMGAEYKKISDIEQKWDNVTKLTNSDDKNRILNFYHHLGKADLIRVDGRINSSGFYLLELSTDVGLSTVSTMTQAYESCGYAYEEMLAQIINNAILSWEYQNANK
ncbi:ATP-grasp domain-containing protein [Thomasclavelia cocleata]|uniref:ATP-grasp domain-containing protein n=1 Tax=Thomasclavelia cocleata TaxID=69824 RepID=UPI00255B3163|nr:ATP-grasp domain-containing protein [Thomasclavelia cocleata]